MNKLLLLLLFMSLACSAPAAPAFLAGVALTVTATPVPGLAVELVGPAAITVLIEDPAGVVYIEPDCVWMLAIGDVNVRAAPSAEAAILHTLLEGQGIEVFAIVDGWAWVKDGYVKAEWLK